jgi:hypothetical protein
MFRDFSGGRIGRRVHKNYRTVFTVLEESGSSLFSLFSPFWKNLEAHCFHYFHCFGRIWKLTVFTIFTVLEESGSSLFSLFSPFWKNLDAHCFHYFHCFGRIWKLTVFTIFTVSTVSTVFTVFTVLEESGSSLFSLTFIWNTVTTPH